VGPVTLSQVEQAFINLGGEATWAEAFEELHRLRGGDFSYYLNWMNYKTTAFQVVQKHCAEYQKFREPARFEKVGVRFRLLFATVPPTTAIPSIVEPPHTPSATDLSDPSKPERVFQDTYRVLRDTKLARSVKDAAGYQCQVCSEVLILKGGLRYAEAHHLQPLGSPHDGPDVWENIICVCPNHHALLDYAALELDQAGFPDAAHKYVEYHNRLVHSVQA
jgi:hypothetical protein